MDYKVTPNKSKNDNIYYKYRNIYVYQELNTTKSNVEKLKVLPRSRKVSSKT